MSLDFPIFPRVCHVRLPWCPVSTTHRAPPPISVAPKASPQLLCRGPALSAPRVRPHPGACREAPRRWRRRNALVTTSGLRSWSLLGWNMVRYGEMLGFTVGFNFGLIMVDYSLNVLMDVDGESRIVLNFLSGTNDLVKKQIKLKTVKKPKKAVSFGQTIRYKASKTSPCCPAQAATKLSKSASDAVIPWASICCTLVAARTCQVGWWDAAMVEDAQAKLDNSCLFWLKGTHGAPPSRQRSAPQDTEAALKTV